jgi:hypothetical protein
LTEIVHRECCVANRLNYRIVPERTAKVVDAE